MTANRGAAQKEAHRWQRWHNVIMWCVRTTEVAVCRFDSRDGARKGTWRGMRPTADTHITRFHVLFDIACTPFLHIPAGPQWFHQALSESPRRLKNAAKACSSWQSHIACAALWGLRADQRLVRRFPAGTSKYHCFYNVFIVTVGHYKNT